MIMLFQIKHVIRKVFLLSFVFMVLSCRESKEDDVILLEKVILLEFNNKDTILINKRANFTTKAISRYYKFRFFNESPVRITKGYDKKREQIIWASTEEQEKLDIRFSNRFKVLDSLLAKKDIESLLEQSHNLSDWQEKDLNKIHDFKISFKSNSNRISKPIYTLNKKYAIICYDFSYTDKNIIIYKKVNNNWVYVSIIKNVL